jgi:hypothetical protein
MYGSRTGAHRVAVGRDLMDRDHLVDVGVDEMIILKLILKMWNGEAWTGLMWLRIGTVSGLL